MSAKHTPGPWRVSAGAVDNPRLIVENDLGLPVCAMSLRGVHGDTKIMEANARLIAAAPDLLEALKNLLRVEESWCNLNEICNRGDLNAAMEKARAAIAKAEGESK